MMKTLVLLTVLVCLTITTARFLDENVSVMALCDLFPGFNMVVECARTIEKASKPVFSFAMIAKFNFLLF